MTVDTSERRRWERVPVEMWVQESRDRELYFQRAANLSKGGMFLENTIPHPYGTKVVLEFVLPGTEKPIRVQGRIVNVPTTGSDLGMGIEFLDVEPSIARLIEALVDKDHVL